MIATVSPYVWYTTRATGTVALLLLTVTMVLGTLTATRVGSAALPRFAVGDLHRRVSLLAMVFLGIHIFTAVIDTYVPIGWWAAVVPFTSQYKPWFVGLGAVAFDLLLAVMATSLLRYRLAPNLWRGVHWLVYACWPVAVLHTIFTGTDLRFGWMDVLVAVCIVSVLAAVAWRVHAHPHRGGLRTAHPRRTAPRRTTGSGRDRLVAGSRTTGRSAGTVRPLSRSGPGGRS